MFEKLDALLDSFIEQGVPGYDCIVYEKGSCVYRRTDGYSDLENKLPVKGNELYNMYSCSKVVTCTAAMMLYEKGLFRLEDRLSDYMPEFGNMTVRTEDGIVPALKPITVENLFTMTAGFSYDVKSPSLIEGVAATDGRAPTREMMRYLAREPLCNEPGTIWRYSLCHDVLAALVEVLSGRKYNDFVTENIFTPLGMKDSTFLLDGSEVHKVACQYRYNDEKKRVESIPKSIYNYKLGSEYASGGAGLVSTVEDYMRFMEGLRTGKLVSADTLRLMATNRLSEEQRRTLFYERYGYGLGLRTPREGSDVIDFGWSGAAGQYVVFDPVHEVSCFYCQHVLNSPNKLERRRVAYVIQEIYEERDRADG